MTETVNELSAFRRFLRRHQFIRTLIHVSVTALVTIGLMLYTNSYEDHVEQQKEFIVVQNMQEDLTEMKTLLKSNNDMMMSLMQDNVATKTLTGQLDVRMTNVENRLSTLETRVYAPKR